MHFFKHVFYVFFVGSLKNHLSSTPISVGKNVRILLPQDLHDKFFWGWATDHPKTPRNISQNIHPEFERVSFQSHQFFQNLNKPFHLPPPNLWRFGSDDFPYHFGGNQLPGSDANMPPELLRNLSGMSGPPSLTRTLGGGEGWTLHIHTARYPMTSLAVHQFGYYCRSH